MPTSFYCTDTPIAPRDKCSINTSFLTHPIYPMSPFFHFMPVDRTTIKTKLHIHPAVFHDPKSFIRDHDLPIRTMKPTRVRRSWTLTLDVLTYKGIKVKLIKIDGDPLTDVTIDFNPGVCHYGHNGQILTLAEFLDALSLLVTQLTPLLSNPADFVDLVPGLSQGRSAYWSFLEVPFQCIDPDGTLLANFRNLRHPRIKTPTRHWPNSIQAGGHRGMLQLSIYRKAMEMVAHGKLPESKLSDYYEILRLEARMREKKLILYFGNSRNVEVIDGTERLVRFYPRDLVGGHRLSFSELQGVYSPDHGTTREQGDSKPLVAMGRLIAQAALDPRTSHTFPELLSQVAFYTGAGSDTISVIRKSGLMELERSSSISRDALYSDAAYGAQFSIASTELEQKICHDLSDMTARSLIAAAYRPPGQPVFPLTVWPSYDRI